MFKNIVNKQMELNNFEKTQEKQREEFKKRQEMKLWELKNENKQNQYQQNQMRNTLPDNYYKDKLLKMEQERKIREKMEQERKIREQENKRNNFFQFQDFKTQEENKKKNFFQFQDFKTQQEKKELFEKNLELKKQLEYSKHSSSLDKIIHPSFSNIKNDLTLKLYNYMIDVSKINDVCNKIKEKLSFKSDNPILKKELFRKNTVLFYKSSSGTKHNIMDFSDFLVQYKPNPNIVLQNTMKLLQSNYVDSESIKDIIKFMKDNLIFANPVEASNVSLEHLPIINLNLK